MNCGLFEPKVMYFGMINSPATFQALIVTFLPWTAPDCVLTSYDYGLSCIISH